MISSKWRIFPVKMKKSGLLNFVWSQIDILVLFANLTNGGFRKWRCFAWSQNPPFSGFYCRQFGHSNLAKTPILIYLKKDLVLTKLNFWPLKCGQNSTFDNFEGPIFTKFEILALNFDQTCNFDNF